MPNRHIYWFAFYDLRSPSVRYRGYHVLNELSSDAEFRTYLFTPSWRFGKIARFIYLICSIHFRSRRNTRVIIQRVHSRGVYATILKLIVVFNKSICFYDLDDAQYVECDPKTIHWFLRNVRGVFVGSGALHAYCSQFNDNVLLLTSATTQHGYRKAERNELFKIGWIGNFWGQHEQNMYELLLPCIKRIEGAIKLEILGVVHEEKEAEIHAFFKNFENVELSIPKNINWQSESEVYKRVSTFDLGVSPLLNTEINRCKSAYKLKQYLSCGVPVVGSEIGENSKFIVEGKNGYLCRSDDDFVNRIEQFRNMTNEEYKVFSSQVAQLTHEFELATVAEDFYRMLSL